MVDEVPCHLLATLNLEREDRARAVGEIPLIEVVVGMVWQRRVVDFLHERLRLEVVDDFQRVEHVALHTQRQCLKSLQENPGVERRDAGAFVAKQQGADACHERSGKLAEDQAVVRGVGLGEARELVVLEIVELAAVNDYATET